MRKFYFIVLALTALAASAQTTATVDGIKYILDGSSATVTYPNASAPGTSEYTGDIVVPASITVDGTDYAVTAIGDKAFRKANISSITLPEGLQTIGEEAFHKSKITSIVVPNSVSKIGHQALSETSTLKEITLGEHIADNDLGIWLCWRESGGYEVTINCDKKPKLYDNQTFDDTHASTIYVRPSVYDSFKEDSKWNIYNIVKMGTELSDFTVDGIKYKMVTEENVYVTYPTESKPGSSNPNPYTGDVVIPAQVTYEGKAYNVTGIADYAFRYATITSITLPEGLLSIGEEAIYNTQITELTLPSTLINMGTYAMAYNANLKKVTFGKDIATNTWGAWVLYRESPEYDVYMDCHVKPTVPDKYTFDHGYQTRVHVYGDVYSDYLNDEYWGGKYTIVPDMGGEVIEFLDFTIDGIKYKMTDKDKVSVVYPTASKPGSSNPNPYTGNIVIPAQVIYEGVTYDVTGIADYAFRYATITSITLPEGLLSIGKEAIYKTDITEIVVPNSVVTLGESCISENANLQTLTFGSHIADKKWGVWVAWRMTGGYEVYMYCDKMPELGDNQTFDDSHESNIHIYPSLYLQYKNNYYWACHHIVADLEEEITADELKSYVADYSALLPASEEVGTDPGFYTPASVKALNDALTYASSLGEDATYEERSKALLALIVATDELEVNALNEGYYYIENVYKERVLYTSASEASEGGLKGKKVAEFDPTSAKYYFKLTRKGGNWIMQSCDDNGLYVGAPIGGNTNGAYISLTENPDNAQAITWVSGGKYTIQNVLDDSSNGFPYSMSTEYTSYVWVYDYAAGSDDTKRIYWRFHPAQSDMFAQEFNIENIRVREYMAEVTYTAADATKMDAYNMAPPTRRDQPSPATIFWTNNTSATAQQITWSTNADFTDALTAEVDPANTCYEIYNLLPGKTYYYKVTATVDGNEKNLLASTFTTSGQLRQIKAEGGGNIRDLGGWATASGNTIQYGRIYRSAELNGKYNLTADGIAAIRAIGVKAELDLRITNEALYISQSPLGEDVTYLRTEHTSSYVDGLEKEPNLYKQALQYVFDCVKADKPVIFHCHIGADRTGTLAFLLEGLLGVSMSDIYKDYELTSFSYFDNVRYKENIDGLFNLILSKEGDTLTDKFYTYINGELGLGEQDIADFRAKMLGIDIPDVIAPVEIAPMEDSAIYNLAGQRLKELQKGINIVNGKKIVW